MSDFEHFAICPECRLGGNHHAELLPASPPLRMERDVGDGEIVTVMSWGGHPARVQRRCTFCQHEWQTTPGRQP